MKNSASTLTSGRSVSRTVRALLCVLASCLCLTLISSAAHGQSVYGTYDGDGTGSRAITGLGFQPDGLLIKRLPNGDKKGGSGNDGKVAAEASFALASMTPGEARVDTSGGESTIASGLIESLDSWGFTIGSTPEVNETGSRKPRTEIREPTTENRWFAVQLKRLISSQKSTRLKA
jgi:hypothetical protein